MIKDYGHNEHKVGLFMSYLPNGKCIVECCICGWKGEPIDGHICDIATSEEMHIKADEFH